MKVLVISGHGAGDIGASAKIDGTLYKESELTRIAAAGVLKALTAAGISVAQYDESRNAYYDYQSGNLKKNANFGAYDYVLEIHFNAGANNPAGNGKTTGVEIYYPSAGEKSGYEEKLLDAISQIGFTRRKAAAGKFAVINTAARAGVKANLLEICFIDDADDIQLWNRETQKICEAISSAIAGQETPKKEEESTVKLDQYSVLLKNIDYIGYIPMAGSKGETVSAAARRKTWKNRTPDVICNAELFNMTTYAAASGVVSGGQAQFLPQALGVAFTGGGKKPTLSYMNNVKAPDWIGAYPLLVRDGKVAFTTVPAGLSGKRARVAFAWNDEKCAVVFAKAASGCTLSQFANGIIELGYTTAANFDGGGSVACITPLASYEQGRKVRGKLGIWIKGGNGNILARNTSAAESSGTSASTSGSVNTTPGRVSAMQRESGCGTGVKLTVTARSGLKIRKAPINGAVQEVVAKGNVVTWYGYYCKETATGKLWYYVQTASGKTGYASAAYLAR